MLLRMLTIALTVMLGCGESEGGGSTSSALPEDTSLLERAQQRGWWLVSGSTFYALGTPIEERILPRDGAEGALRTRIFRAFDIRRDGLLVVAETAGSGGMHLVVFDAEMNILYEDPSLLAHQLYAPYRWSPDGRFISYAHGNELRLIEWSTKQTRVLSSRHASVMRDGPPMSPPSWSADSSQIVYQTNAGEIVIHHVENGAERVVGAGRQQLWSPDGRVIVYLRGRGMSPNEVLAYDPSTGATRTLFPCRFHTEIAFTPDSQHLLVHGLAATSTSSPLRAWSFAEARLVTTGQNVMSIRNGQVTTLPEAWTQRLEVR